MANTASNLRTEQLKRDSSTVVLRRNTSHESVEVVKLRSRVPGHDNPLYKAGLLDLTPRESRIAFKAPVPHVPHRPTTCKPSVAPQKAPLRRASMVRPLITLSGTSISPTVKPLVKGASLELEMNAIISPKFTPAPPPTPKPGSTLHLTSRRVRPRIDIRQSIEALRQATTNPPASMQDAVVNGCAMNKASRPRVGPRVLRKR
ncbi:uncharacterized protein LOC106180232 [Lingula anatina]|uniref:Uncharacterized protein LOC106180232 n=1 Tax=Lingula anatina TaxID=7574 RepID=A0A1S3KAT6_LINAN|nr:uncharacterized protein LOC106180232 [Lingula anatina]|eukprot:XP_013419602.1 uncharacterized protein LOC106180232 [Lingula anatina]